MKNIYVLVGNIASGKSTWVNDFKLRNSCVVISKDDIRKQFARSIGKKYIYETHLECRIHEITKSLLLGYAPLGTENIIIDETHMHPETRSFTLKVGKGFDYEVKAVVFPDCGEDVHVKRRMGDNHGAIEDGCTEEIWREVYNRKKKRFVFPTIGEGFDDIIQFKH